MTFELGIIVGVLATVFFEVIFIWVILYMLKQIDKENWGTK